MPITAIITSTKPDEAAFFGQVPSNVETVIEINQWISTLPGFVSQDLNISDKNVRIHTVVFDTVDNYANWFSQRDSRPGFAERIEYNKLNNIITTFEETIS